MAKTNHDQKETSSVKPLNLADEYAQRHRQMENYIFIWHISFAILRRFGIDPVSNKGRILLAFGFTMVLCLLAVVTSAITRQWDQLQSFTWVPVAIGLGFIVGFAYSWYLSATDDFLTIHQAIKDDAGLRWLIAWDRRWFNVRVVGLIGFTYTIIVLIGLYIIQQQTSSEMIPAYAFVFGALVLLLIGENAFINVLLAVESHFLAQFNYDLFRLSPIDSVELKQSIRGINQLSILTSLLGTAGILGFIILLPLDSSIIGPATLVLLVLTYLGITLGNVAPRKMMESIVRKQKKGELASLQRQLNSFSGRLRELTEEEYDEMKRLEDMHNKIIISSENLLPLGVVARVLGTLLVPTITFAFATAGERIVLSAIERFLP